MPAIQLQISIKLVFIKYICK